MVEVIMIIIFMMINISMVGIFAFVYSDLGSYSDGMIFGVHIPKEEINNEEVQTMVKRFKKNLKKFNLWNFLIGSLICFLCLLNIALFILLWSLWLFEYLGIGFYLIIASHRKIYAMKMKNNWILEGNTHIVHIDTVVSAMSDKLPITHWWNVPAFAGIFLLLLPPQMREYFGSNPVQWAFPGVVLLMSILFWGLHLWFIRKNNVVYSSDSSVNLAVNRTEKRTWSALLLGANYVNLLGWSYLAVKIMLNRWLYDADYWIYIILQMVPAIMIVIGVMYIQKKRKEVLSMDSATLTVDDDEYWKKGWYSNPNDTHLWVKDRFNSTNYSMNMAKPAAKIATVATAVFTTVILVFVFALLLSLENASVSFRMEASQVTIDAAMYDTNFNVNEIRSVKIIDQLPADDYIRTNGGDTEKYLIGHFKGKTIGKCMLFLYRDYAPILEIKLKDETVFVNSKDKNEVQEWYEELTEKYLKRNADGGCRINK